jgi:hypothetical protein
MAQGCFHCLCRRAGRTCPYCSEVRQILAEGFGVVLGQGHGQGLDVGGRVRVRLHGQVLRGLPVLRGRGLSHLGHDTVEFLDKLAAVGLALLDEVLVLAGGTEETAANIPALGLVRFRMGTAVAEDFWA